MTNYKIMVDMDGVIADFGKAVKKIMPEFIEGVNEKNKKLDGKMWGKIGKYQKTGEFWFDLEPMEDAFVLWNFVKPYDPEILSAYGDPKFGAREQKIKWIAKHLGSTVRANLVQRSVDKAVFARPNIILIDDKRKALDPFIAAGGIGILHTSAADSIAQLKAIIKL